MISWARSRSLKPGQYKLWQCKKHKKQEEGGIKGRKLSYQRSEEKY